MAQWEVYDPVSSDFGNSAVVLIIGVRICAYEELQRFSLKISIILITLFAFTSQNHYLCTGFP